MQCCNCLKFFNDSYDFCPYCGHEKIDYDLCPSEEDSKFKSELFYIIGMRLIKEFKTGDALKAFNESLKFNKENIKVWRNKANLLNDKYGGQYQKAMDCISKALSIKPDDLESLVLKGKILKNMGDDKSENYFRNLLKECVENDEISLIAKGDILYELEDNDSAIDAYSQALEINPLNADTWHKKGKLLGYSRRYEECVNCFRKSLELNPYDIKLWRDLSLYSPNSIYELDAISNSLLIFPKSHYEWGQKGDKLKSLGDWENAIKCYDREMELSSLKKTDNSYISQAQCYMELDKYWDAIESFDKALKIWPENSFSVRCKGDCYYELEMYPEALDCYNVCIENNYSDGSLIISKGETLLKISEEEGKKYLESLLDENYSLDIKGRIYRLLDENEKALECYSKAIEKNNYSVHYFYSLKGSLLYDVGKKQEALSCFNKSIENYSNEFALYYKGQILIEFEEYEKALECFEEILQSKPFDKKIISKKEEILKELG